MYAQLHALSNFSFLRGASHPEELVAQAKHLNYRALALTDESSLAGVVRAHVAAKQGELPLIIGAELSCVDALKLVALATDRASYGALSRLITRARRGGAKGHYGVELLTGGSDAKRLALLQALGAALELPRVAAGDVHLHRRSRRALQDVLTAIRLGIPLHEAGVRLFPNGERCLRPLERLRELYPAALLEQTLAIAERCTFNLEELRYEYPEEIVPAGEDPTSHLRALTMRGCASRWPAGPAPK